jgi:hypothetical protein
MQFLKCFHPYRACLKRALEKHFKTHLMLQNSGISQLRILGLCAFFLFSACQQQSEATFTKGSPAPPQGDLSPVRSEAAAPESNFQDAALNGELFSSAASIPSGIDSLKKFVRGAEIKFSVNNTADATLRIEDIALRHGRFVINSTLNSEVELRQNTPMNRDSAIETTRYTLHSQIVLRVRYRQLDTTIRSIGKLSVFLDQRRVSAEDVGLHMFEKELARLREGIYRSDYAFFMLGIITFALNYGKSKMPHHRLWPCWLLSRHLCRTRWSQPHALHWPSAWWTTHDHQRS